MNRHVNVFLFSHGLRRPLGKGRWTLWEPDRDVSLSCPSLELETIIHLGPDWAVVHPAFRNILWCNMSHIQRGWNFYSDHYSPKCKELFVAFAAPMLQKQCLVQLSHWLCLKEIVPEFMMIISNYLILFYFFYFFFSGMITLSDTQMFNHCIILVKLKRI